MSVSRRFSDFLGLHERLNAKYLLQGKVVPPAPEKSVLGQFGLLPIQLAINIARMCNMSI